MLGALSAGFDTVLHITDLFAALGTCFTDFGADCTGAFVKLAAHQHEVRRGLADLGACHHEPEVSRFDMPTALLQAVIHGCAEASAVATQAFVDAALHVLGNMVHVGSPCLESAGMDQRQARRRSLTATYDAAEGLRRQV